MLLFMAGITAAQEVPTQTAGKPGRISGVVFDAKSGEKLPGVTIMVQLSTDTISQTASMTGKTVSLGAKSNLNGEYLVRSVPPGMYTISVTMIGYAKSMISDVEVTPDGLAKLDISLSTEDVQLKNDIKVKAKRDPRSTSANDIVRQKASGAMDIVSAEQIGRSGVGDAEGALAKVTGVSVMGDQAYVRGVNDRYLSVQLNGSTMPSSEMDKQTFRTDIVATNLLDNISVQKTYTPDQPGNTTGGGINLSTKSYPETRSLVFSGGFSYNELVTGNEDFLTSTGSSSDMWGHDNGYREMPEVLKENIRSLPGQAPLGYTSEQAHLLENVLHSLHNDVEPSKSKAPFNRSFGFSYGDNLTLFERNLGIVGVFSYDRKYKHYDHGLEQTYDASVEAGSNQATIRKGGVETKSEDNVNWNVLGTLSFSPASNHDLTFTYVRNQEGLQETEVFDNYFDVGAIQRPSYYRIQTLSYTERSLSSFQLKGGHKLASMGSSGIRFDWQVSTSIAKQNEPDKRSFYDFASVYETDSYDSLGNMILDTNFTPQSPGSSSHSNRMWRYLDEKNREAKADLTIPVIETAKLKTGFDYMTKDRSHEEYGVQILNDNEYTNKFGTYYYYDGSWEQYFADAGGIRDSTNGKFYLGPVYTGFTDKQNNYDGYQDITSWYGMLDVVLIANLKAIIGARYEKTDMKITAKFDTTLVQGVDFPQPLHLNEGDEMASLKQGDWLPSVNLIYTVTERMNLRAAYSRTLARPSLRELSPAKSTDHARADEYYGNPFIKRTLINNFDIRWEWFTKPGEVFAVSGFYKKFKDPIELTFIEIGANDALMPMNTTSGELYGIEFETRKNLGMFGRFAQPFSLGANVTLTHSNVDLTERERIYYKRAGLEESRPLQGQPPYVVNGDLTFKHARLGTRASLIYNIVGDQVYINSSRSAPDVYEQHRSILDFTLSQPLWAGLNFNFAAKNILNKDLVRFYKLPKFVNQVEETAGHTVTDGLAAYELYPIGTSVSASLSWQIW
jgi:TonB-dependent receptor